MFKNKIKINKFKIFQIMEVIFLNKMINLIISTIKFKQIGLN